jgi:hypothetical protein
MSLGHVDTLLSDFLENHLQKPYMEKIKSHLVFCNACRHALQDLEKNKAALASLAPVVLPTGLEERISVALKTQAATTMNLANENVPSPEMPRKPSEPINWASIFKVSGVLIVAAVVYAAFQLVPKTDTPTPVPMPDEKPLPDTQQTFEVAPATSVAKSLPVEPPPVASKPIAPAPPVKPPQQEPMGEIDLSGASSGQDQPLEVIIRTDSAWKELWAKHTKNITPPPAIPAIDFNKNDVIAVFAGNQSNGGYSIRIVSVEETTWEGLPARIAHLKTSEPTPGSINTMAITQPYHIKTTPKLAGKVYFRRNR